MSAGLGKDHCVTSDIFGGIKKVGYRMKFLAASVMAMLSLALLMSGTNMAGEKKIETKEVMKRAMKGGLCTKCAPRQASRIVS